MENLNHFKTGDIVHRSFCGKMFKIIDGSKDLYKLECLETGYIHTLNACNNGGFTKVEPLQQLKLF